MIVAGIDAGITALKVVIVGDGTPLSCTVIRASSEPTMQLLEEAVREAADKACLEQKAIERIAITGSLADQVSIPAERMSESSCLAKGAERLVPSVGTVVDMGAHKCLVVRCQRGSVVKIARSDRCASGSGLYLEMVAHLLGLEMASISRFTSLPKSSLRIESHCAVFGESEIITLIHQGKKPEAILGAVFDAIAVRILPLLLNVNFKEDVVAVGGVARVQGIISSLEREAHCQVIAAESPEIVGALGAALLAEPHEVLS